MYRASYLESKGSEVLCAEKWARNIRKVAIALCVIFAIIMFASFTITTSENDKLREEYASRGFSEEKIETLVPSDGAVFLSDLAITLLVDVPMLLVLYFIAMLLELRAADVHNKTIIANCALYRIYNEDDDEETEE